MANKKKKVTQATRRKISRASKLYQKVRKTVSKELEKQEKPLKKWQFAGEVAVFY